MSHDARTHRSAMSDPVDRARGRMLQEELLRAMENAVASAATRLGRRP